MEECNAVISKLNVFKMKPFEESCLIDLHIQPKFQLPEINFVICQARVFRLKIRSFVFLIFTPFWSLDRGSFTPNEFFHEKVKNTKTREQILRQLKNLDKWRANKQITQSQCTPAWGIPKPLKNQRFIASNFRNT